MEELGLRPTTSIVLKVGDVLQKLGMMDKYEKLNRKYPPPKWEYRYIKGKRVKVRATQPNESSDEYEDVNKFNGRGIESIGADEVINSADEVINSSDEKNDQQLMGFLGDDSGSIVLDETREGTL